MDWKDWAGVNWVLWTLLASIPFMVQAWRVGWRGRYPLAIGYLLFAGFLLRFGPAMDPFLHTWDERYHALVAKNMIGHMLEPMLYKEHVLPYDPLSWTEGHIWLHKPPFTLWCMSISMRLFGATVFAARFPSLLASTLGIALSYGIIRRFFGRRVGFIAAFLYTVQGMVIEVSSGRVATDHVDALFAFLIPLSIYTYQRWSEGRSWIWVGLSGVTLGAAVLTKWLPALIAVPVCGLYFMGRRKWTWRVLLGAAAVQLAVGALVAAPWVIYASNTFPEIYAHEARMRGEHITHVLDGQGGSVLYYVDRLRIAYGELVYLPCAWFVWSLSRHAGFRTARWSILLWWLGFYLFFSLVSTKMQGYVMPATIPVLAIAAAFWVLLERKLRAGGQWRWGVYVVLVVLLALPVRYCVERLKPLQDLSAKVQERAALESFMDHTSGCTVLWGCELSIEAMFYRDGIAYGRSLDGSDSSAVLDSGCRMLQWSP